MDFFSNVPDNFIPPDDAVGKRLLREYGAVFVARHSDPPPVVIFRNSDEVDEFQSSIEFHSSKVGDIKIELQPRAFEQFSAAATKARLAGLTITPRGPDAARRTYRETVQLWASRVEPGLYHWVDKGLIDRAEAEKIRRLSAFDQVEEIFRLEEEGIFFSKDRSKTIIYSVAPPGASQHLSMLAIDVNEHADLEVREVLAAHEWHQTVISDLPHFTFLGTSENGLPKLGLKRVEQGDRGFWVPDI